MNAKEIDELLKKTLLENAVLRGKLDAVAPLIETLNNEHNHWKIENDCCEDGPCPLSKQLDALFTLPPEIVDVEIHAWVGEDEFGSGVVGLKQAQVPAGMIPLAATSRAKLDRPDIRYQLEEQVATYGKTIRLVRYRAVEVEIELVKE